MQDTRQDRRRKNPGILTTINFVRNFEPVVRFNNNNFARNS